MADLFDVDARHVDVAILYGIGMKDRAQYIARQLRPMNRVEYAVPPGYGITNGGDSTFSFSGPGRYDQDGMNETPEGLSND